MYPMSAADHGPSWLPWRSAAAALDVDGWLVVVVGLGCRQETETGGWAGLDEEGLRFLATAQVAVWIPDRGVDDRPAASGRLDGRTCAGLPRTSH